MMVDVHRGTASPPGDLVPPQGATTRSSEEPAVRRSGRHRRQQVKDDFIDSSLLHYISFGGGAAEKPANPRPSKSQTDRSPSHTAETDTEDYFEDDQADLPVLRPMPAQPLPEEAKFLPAAPVYPPSQHKAQGSNDDRFGAAGARASPNIKGFRASYMKAPRGAARRALLAAALDAMNAKMGQTLVQDLGLQLLGAKLQATWQLHEELLFCIGMNDAYRRFEFIRDCYLTQRSVHELNGFYYNVWKTRSSPIAEAFLGLRDSMASQEELDAFGQELRRHLSIMWDSQTMGAMPEIAWPQEPAAAAAASSGQGGSSNAAAAAAAHAAVAATAQARAGSGQAADIAMLRTVQSIGPPGSTRRSSKAGKQAQKPARAPASVKAGPSAANAARAQAGRKQQQQQQQQQQQPPLPELLKFPDMPQMPVADLNDPASVEDWLRGLPRCRAAIETYKKQVEQATEQAVQECQRRIQHLQQQCEQALSRANDFTHSLISTGNQLLEHIKQQQQHQQRPGGVPALQVTPQLPQQQQDLKPAHQQVQARQVQAQQLSQREQDSQQADALAAAGHPRPQPTAAGTNATPAAAQPARLADAVRQLLLAHQPKRSRSGTLNSSTRTSAQQDKQGHQQQQQRQQQQPTEKPAGQCPVNGQGLGTSGGATAAGSAGPFAAKAGGACRMDVGSSGASGSSALSPAASLPFPAGPAGLWAGVTVTGQDDTKAHVGSFAEPEPKRSKLDSGAEVFVVHGAAGGGGRCGDAGVACPV